MVGGLTFEEFLACILGMESFVLDIPCAIPDQHVEQRQDLFFSVTREMTNEGVLLKVSCCDARHTIWI